MQSRVALVFATAAGLAACIVVERPGAVQDSDAGPGQPDNSSGSSSGGTKVDGSAGSSSSSSSGSNPVAPFDSCFENGSLVLGDDFEGTGWSSEWINVTDKSPKPSIDATGGDPGGALRTVAEAGVSGGQFSTLCANFDQMQRFAIEFSYRPSL
jgi:hypothetical protein